MNRLPCCKKQPKMYELKFMNLCTEGCYNRPEALDELWNEAVAENKDREILDAVDDAGDTPIQKCGQYGNPTVLQWVINKWKGQGKELDLEQKDSEGNTPLMAACIKGYLGSEAIAGKLFATKEKRLEVVTILVKEGADINVVSRMVNMTPLHWAAYNDDPNLVVFLLKAGAKLTFSKRRKNGEGDVTAVDIAGNMDYDDVIYVFAKWLEAKITQEMIEKAEGA